MPTRRKPCQCFYCRAILSDGNAERDHFPLPKAAKGKLTVWACKACHDMKDRYNAGQWPKEWVDAFLRNDWPRLSREGRLLMAKIVRVLALPKSS